jgi:hypothetical protein
MFRWLLGAFVALLLVLSAALSVWLLQSQQHSNEQIQALQEKFDKLLRGVNSFAEVQNKVRQEQPGQKPDELEQHTYEQLGKELGVDPVSLREQLPRFAEELKKAPNATTYERANAAYTAKDYDEAERLALVAADEAQRAGQSPYPEALFRTLGDNLACPLYLRRSQTNPVAEILLNVWRSLLCGKRKSESNGKADVCAVQALFEGR